MSSERVPLSAAGLTADGAPLAPWHRVVAVRTAGPGGRATAIYYAAAGRRGRCRGGRAPPVRVQRDVDDPSGQPGVAGWRDLHGLRALVVANGAAGKGAGVRAARGVVARVLRDAGLEVVVRATEGVGHAADLAAESWEGAGVHVVVSVGGDGTLHEVVNGLVRGMGRRAAGGGAAGALRYPLVGVVPAGSGNAIAQSMGVTTVLDGALNVVHGLRVRGELALNLMQYGRIMRRRVSDPALETVRESLAIGGIAWGLVADVDLGTDRLRWMGDARFDVGGLAAILRGKVAYARLRLRLHRALQHDVDKRLEARGGGSCGRALERAGDQDVILDGRFVSVLAWNAVWQSASAAMTPYARIDEPCFDVLVLREGISRIALIKAMLKMGRGTDDFVRETDGVEYYKCRRIAFERLEGDWLSVDGESVPVEPFYLSLAPETGHVRLLHTDRVDE